MTSSRDLSLEKDGFSTSQPRSALHGAGGEAGGAGPEPAKSWPKDFRTPEAKKWADEYIPPETCADIDDVQNALEHLRDTNSQLRHAAHVWKHCAEDELRRRVGLGDALRECHHRLSEILRLCAMNGAPQERLTAIFAAAEHGRFAALSVSTASPGRPAK